MLLANRVNNFFDDFFKDSFFSQPSLIENYQTMKTDIQEKENGYEVKMDLPGFRKEEVTAELKDGYLVISAAHNESNEEKDEKGNFLRRERYTGTCSRSFYVGKGIKQEDIVANFEEGVLKLEFPKTALETGDAPKLIEIK